MVFPVRYAQEGVVKQLMSGMLSENFFIFRALEMPFLMFFLDIHNLEHLKLEDTGTLEYS